MRGMHRSQSGGTLIETAFLCRNNTDDIVDDPTSNFASMTIKSSQDCPKSQKRIRGRRERGQPTIMSKTLNKTSKLKDNHKYYSHSTNNNESNDEKEIFTSDSYCKENINCQSAPCTPPSASLKLVRRLFLSPMESWRTPPSRMKHSPNVWDLGAVANNNNKECDEPKECPSMSSYDSISGSLKNSQKSSKKEVERRRKLVPSWSRISTLLNSAGTNNNNHNKTKSSTLSRSTSLEMNKSSDFYSDTYIESDFAPNQLQSSPTPAATSSTRSTTTTSTSGTPRSSGSNALSTLSAPKVVLRRKRLKFSSILSPIADKSPDSFNSSVLSSVTAPFIANDEVQDALNVPWEVPKLRNRLKQEKESKNGLKDVNFPNLSSNLASKNEFKGVHRDSDSGISTTSSQGRPTSLPTGKVLPVAKFKEEERDFYLEEKRRSKLFLSFDNKVDCSRLKTLMFLTDSPFDLNDCVQIDPLLDIREQNFYHGKIRREDAELLLKGEPEGTYLVRKSLCNGASKDQFALVVRSARGFMHLRICSVEGGYEVSALDRVFSSVSAIVHHYSRNRLNIKGAEHLCLKWPLQVQESL